MTRRIHRRRRLARAGQNNASAPEEIDPAHLPAVLEGLAQARRKEFATDADVEAAFRRFEQ
jgi:hypothetical protein